MAIISQFTSKAKEESGVGKSEDMEKLYLTQFNKFKEELEGIDKKYSADIGSVDVAMPDSLGLTKREYEMPTEDELYKLAKEALQSKYQTSKHSIEESDSKSKNNFQNKMTEAEQDATKSKEKLNRSLAKEISAIKEDATGKGVARSSIVTSAVERAQKEYGEKASDVDGEYQDKVQLITTGLEQLANQTKQALEALQQSHDSEVVAKAQKMLEDAQKEYQEVVKYNNSIDEKETKYQKERAEALNKAYNDEVERAQKIVQMYNTIGKSGVEKMAMQEKLEKAKEYFASMPKSIAQKLIQSDSSMRHYFGEYYDYLLSYLKGLNRI